MQCWCRYYKICVVCTLNTVRKVPLRRERPKKASLVPTRREFFVFDFNFVLIESNSKRMWHTHTLRQQIYVDSFEYNDNYRNAQLRKYHRFPNEQRKKRIQIHSPAWSHICRVSGISERYSYSIVVDKLQVPGVQRIIYSSI